jgi:hypothetical protein
MRGGPGRRGRESPVERRGDFAALVHHLPERRQRQGLGPVAQRPLWIGVDLDDQAVGPGGDGGTPPVRLVVQRNAIGLTSPARFC